MMTAFRKYEVKVRMRQQRSENAKKMIFEKSKLKSRVKVEAIKPIAQKKKGELYLSTM